MSVSELVAQQLSEIRRFAEAGPAPDLRERARSPLASLLDDIEPLELPETLFAAPLSSPDEYRANWNHQLWYHLNELVRIHEHRRERARAQGGDSWVNQPMPDPESELQSQLQELTKVMRLIDEPPELVKSSTTETIFEDALLETNDAWDHPPALAIERHPTEGVAWTGQNPGGDWFWLKPPLPAAPISISVELKPISTIAGGLIIAFCTRPLKPGTPFSVASGPRMSDYFANFDAYHFSVHRGATGYCNLRRCGPGLIMLASFADPCPDRGRWYAIEIVKAGTQVELRVDGKLVVCYLDCGCIQPRLGEGHFGLRHFQGFRGWQRNVRIARLP